MKIRHHHQQQQHSSTSKRKEADENKDKQQETGENATSSPKGEKSSKHTSKGKEEGVATATALEAPKQKTSFRRGKVTKSFKHETSSKQPSSPKELNPQKNNTSIRGLRGGKQVKSSEKQNQKQTTTDESSDGPGGNNKKVKIVEHAGGSNNTNAKTGSTSRQRGKSPASRGRGRSKSPFKRRSSNNTEERDDGDIDERKGRHKKKVNFMINNSSVVVPLTEEVRDGPSSTENEENILSSISKALPQVRDIAAQAYTYEHSNQPKLAYDKLIELQSFIQNLLHKSTSNSNCTTPIEEAMLRFALADSSFRSGLLHERNFNELKRANELYKEALVQYRELRSNLLSYNVNNSTTSTTNKNNKDNLKRSEENENDQSEFQNSDEYYQLRTDISLNECVVLIQMSFVYIQEQQWFLAEESCYDALDTLEEFGKQLHGSINKQNQGSDNNNKKQKTTRNSILKRMRTLYQHVMLNLDLIEDELEQKKEASGSQLVISTKSRSHGRIIPKRTKKKKNTSQQRSTSTENYDDGDSVTTMSISSIPSRLFACVTGAGTTTIETSDSNKKKTSFDSQDVYSSSYTPFTVDSCADKKEEGEDLIDDSNKRTTASANIINRNDTGSTSSTNKNDDTTSISSSGHAGYMRQFLVRSDSTEEHCNIHRTNTSSTSMGERDTIEEGDVESSETATITKWFERIVLMGGCSTATDNAAAAADAATTTVTDKENTTTTNTEGRNIKVNNNEDHQQDDEAQRKTPTRANTRKSKKRKKNKNPLKDLTLKDE